MVQSVVSTQQRIDVARTQDFDLGLAHVRPAHLEICVGTMTEAVEHRVMQLLVALAQANGAPLSRDDLIETCWGGLAVSDDAVNQCVSKLRRALSKVPGVRVESVPRVGYRLVGPAKPKPANPLIAMNRRTAVTMGIAAAAVGPIFYLRPRSGIGNESIAVVPFANLSGDPSQVYFSDGMAEEVRNALASIDGLKVAGRTSSEAVQNADATEIARRLHVRNVLTGSVRRSPAIVRVAAQLIDGKSGVERWSRTYDLAPGDAIALQTQIAESVAAALSLELGGDNLRMLAQGGTRNAAALDLYLQAKHAFLTSDTLPTMKQVMALCDAAIGLDGNYAAAYALKGMTWDAFSGAFAGNIQELRQGYSNGAAAARKAISIAPGMASGYVALARSMSGSLNVRGAIEQFRKAERSRTADVALLHAFVLLLSETGRTTEGLLFAEKLLALDPLNAGALGMRGFALFYSKRFEDAIRSLEDSLRIAPGNSQYRNLVGDCFELLGRYDLARAQYAQTPADDAFRLTGEAIVAARSGNRERSSELLTKVQQIYGVPASYQQAQILAQLGDKDAAFAALHRGRMVLDPGLTALPADPFMDPLRSDYRYEALMRTLDFG